MNGDDRVEFLFAGVGEHPVAHNARVVDQDVEAAEDLHCARDDGRRSLMAVDQMVGRLMDELKQREEVDDTLSKADASKRIDELQEKTGRGK